MKKYLYLTIMMMPATLLVRGQGSGHDTLIKGSVIEVIQSYTPQVRQAPKPEWTPQIPPPDTFHRIFNYVVPQQPLFYTYHSDALKPLALGKDSVPPPLPDYVKAGVGNLSTLFLDAGIANLDKQNLETYIHLHHLSQKGNEQFQQSSLSGLEAEGMLYGDNSVLHMGLQAERNQYYYYGYDHSLFDYRNGDSLKQTYSSVLLSADLKRKDLGDSKFDYHPQVYGSYYGARANTGEAGVGVFLPMTYDFDSVYQIECIVSEDLAQLKTDSPGVTNNIFKVSPGFSMVKGDLSGHAYLGLATSNSGIFSVLPDIEGKIILPGTKFGLNGGWVSNLAQNTYQDLTRDNPYIYNNYQLAHTRTDQLFVGIKTDFGSMEVNGRVAWCNFKSLPVFLDTSGDRKQFSVKYDTVSAVLLQVGGKYFRHTEENPLTIKGFFL